LPDAKRRLPEESPFIGRSSRDRRSLGSASDFLETSSLTAETAEVEELGAANLVGAELLDLVDNLGVIGEDTLDALAEAHLADGKSSLRALLASDDHAFEGLETLFIAFFDLDLHADKVAGGEVGKVGALKLVSEFLHDRMNGHGVIPYVKSQDSVYMKKRNLQREIHKAAAKRLSGGSLMAGAEPESGKEFAIAVREFCVYEEVWPVGESLGEGGLAAPLANLKVVAFGEDVGDGGAAEVGGGGVVGVIEEASGAVGGAGDTVGGHGVGGGVAFAEAFEA
jgi:hypothetical protein